MGDGKQQNRPDRYESATGRAETGLAVRGDTEAIKGNYGTH